VSTGVYEVVYDVKTVDAGLVAPIASAWGTEVGGTSVATIVSVNQVSDATLLTIEIFTVISVVDDSGVALREGDTNFSLVIFGTF
jgi:hypothetical protein